jgi:hypothetical protein
MVVSILVGRTEEDYGLDRMDRQRRRAAIRTKQTIFYEKLAAKTKMKGGGN